MPAKLLSCSFLPLLLPCFALSLLLPLVSPSPSAPPTLTILLLSILFIFLFPYTFPTLPPAISIWPARPLRVVLLRLVAVSSRRGARSDRGSHPHSAQNKAAFYKKSQDLSFRRLNISVRIFIVFFFFCSCLSGSGFCPAESYPGEDVFVKETIVRQSLADSMGTKFKTKRAELSKRMTHFYA